MQVPCCSIVVTGDIATERLQPELNEKVHLNFLTVVTGDIATERLQPELNEKVHLNFLTVVTGDIATERLQLTAYLARVHKRYQW